MRSISFAGCAWLLTYQMGVAKFIQENLQTHTMQFLGASSGAAVALMLVAGGNFDGALQSALDFARHSKTRLFGPVGKMSHYLMTGLKTHLPKDAFRKAENRLFISVTELPFLKNKLLPAANTQSNEDLLRMVLASCYIPLYYEKPVVMGGRLYIDGGLTNNIPVLGPETIRVSPKPSWHRGGFHIFPQEEPRTLHAFFPDLKVMEALFQQGIDDARSFFRRKRPSAASAPKTPFGAINSSRIAERSPVRSSKSHS